jgi:putative phosphoribosyl transferase
MSIYAVEPDDTAIRIPVADHTWMTADIATPPDASGVVLFAQGRGSARLNPRNHFVASELNRHHLATVVADLLRDDEEADMSLPQLTKRLALLIDWARRQDAIATLPMGLFGAGTGAAAALDAAADQKSGIRAIVSRGGRPDLASKLRIVRVPTLLIVGAGDVSVLRANVDALAELACTKQLAVIPRATHLFEEPGALNAVAVTAAEWFQRFLNSG